MEGLSCGELGRLFDLEFNLEWGSLPLVQLDPGNAADILDSYVNTYIREEIREEGLVRHAPPFLRFLSIAGLLNGQVVNAHNIAREAAVPRSTVDVYFSILEETLLLHFLPAYRPGLKVRESAHPKLYWFDAGVARAAGGLLFDPPDRTWLGYALETFIYHELRVYNHVHGKHRNIFFYRTGSGSEIDFVIETRKRQTASSAHLVCLEVKSAEKWKRNWERSMRSLDAHPGIEVDRMIGIYRGKREYHFDGVDIFPVESFLKSLHGGEIFQEVTENG